MSILEMGGLPVDNLFLNALEDNLSNEAPLAERMRPRSLAEFEEQSSIVGKGTLLRRTIETD
ncbi:MAG TPA: AAA family ATPase, partial [Desulfotomaculum sp.]|nr:AAA family ATPase [Desulfotomaculum sp.]